MLTALNQLHAGVAFHLFDLLDGGFLGTAVLQIFPVMHLGDFLQNIGPEFRSPIDFTLRLFAGIA